MTPGSHVLFNLKDRRDRLAYSAGPQLTRRISDGSTLLVVRRWLSIYGVTSMRVVALLAGQRREWTGVRVRVRVRTVEIILSGLQREESGMEKGFQ